MGIDDNGSLDPQLQAGILRQRCVRNHAERDDRHVRGDRPSGCQTDPEILSRVDAFQSIGEYETDPFGTEMVVDVGRHLGVQLRQDVS